MSEINLMEKYPKTKRDLNSRIDGKTEEVREIARRFDEVFFDGDRSYGYGGFSYHPRFWGEVVKDFIKHYNLKEGSKIFDIGCAKGFMLHDFNQAMPGLVLKGIDISKYAIEKCIDDMKPFVSVGNANDLSMYSDNEFDLVICINTVHNLELDECKHALKEMQRIGKNAFIMVDAWRNDEEKDAMIKWNLTAKTFMHVNDWVKMFEEVGYEGDYHWFVP